MVYNYTAPSGISVTISLSSLELRRVGDTKLLTATVLPATANQAVIWASSNPAVAMVDPTSGLVTAKASGMATIIATSLADSSKIGTCVVEVMSTAGN
jgi:uncharacterized protein YjdB